MENIQKVCHPNADSETEKHLKYKSKQATRQTMVWLVSNQGTAIEISEQALAKSTTLVDCMSTLDNPSELPLSMSTQVLQIVVDFLEENPFTIPPELAQEVLYAADFLQI